MHPEVLEWVSQFAPATPVTVLDIGGRDINGNPEFLFHDRTRWEIVDLLQGDRVTWVGDIADYQGGPFDVVLCLEVAEHTLSWPIICARAAELTRPGGVFIFTAAGPGRAPHSAIHGGDLIDGEHYENVTPGDLHNVLGRYFPAVHVEVLGHDVRAVCRQGPL